MVCIDLWDRLSNSNLDYNEKFPILLNNNHYLTELIIRDCHENVFHNGFKHTLAKLRENYWIVCGRSFIKKLLRKCVICNRFNTRSYRYPSISNLPKSRVTLGLPFQTVGIDYFGPLFYKVERHNKEDMFKCYVVLYTCTITRCILLDLVKNGNTPTFINSLRTFISRRGCPHLILSDNGTVFTATETQKFVADRGITWNFNLAKAPWQGGVWERLVSLCKRSLKKVIGKNKLNFTELNVVIYEVESILNNRPLCNIYDDTNDVIITPNHLLFGRALETSVLSKSNKLVSHSLSTADSSTKRYKHLENILNEFWRIWKRDYLLQLRQTQNVNKTSGANPKINDIVIIYEDKIPRQLWKIGRIKELLKSKDSQIRGAKVKVGKTGNTIERPINKLYPLEINDSENTEIIEHNLDVNDITKTESTGEDNNIKRRPKRQAALLSDLKRRYLNTC